MILARGLWPAALLTLAALGAAWLLARAMAPRRAGMAFAAEGAA